MFLRALPASFRVVLRARWRRRASRNPAVTQLEEGGRAMSWLRIDDQLTFHAKIVDAGNAAVGAWVRMSAWSCAYLTDGRVPANITAMVATEEEIAALVRTRLLDPIEGGGYVIHDFLHWNPPAADVKARRDADRQRKASRGRASSGRFSAPHVPEESVTIPIGIREDSSVATEATSDTAIPIKARENADGSFGMTVDGWCDGVRSVTRSPCTRPMGRAGGALVDALKAHRTPGVDAVEDARQLGAAYAKAKEGGTLSPFGFADWLNSGRPAKGQGLKAVGPDLSRSPAHRPFPTTKRPVSAT